MIKVVQRLTKNSKTAKVANKVLVAVGVPISPVGLAGETRTDHSEGEEAAEASDRALGPVLLPLDGQCYATNFGDQEKLTDICYGVLTTCIMVTTRKWVH